MACPIPQGVSCDLAIQAARPSPLLDPKYHKMSKVENFDSPPGQLLELYVGCWTLDGKKALVRLHLGQTKTLSLAWHRRV